MQLIEGKFNANDIHFDNPGIFCEAALIRDVYFSKKPNVKELMDTIVEFIMQHYKIKGDCRNYSQLPAKLNNCHITHPNGIKKTAKDDAIYLSQNEKNIWNSSSIV